ncbi:MAG: hypothetical protein KGH94_04120 [Candidatus Micrarchaeota archaeon]|nr:hypothetical protein [Candidatus Micrarchaeota archaeon]
MDKESLVNGLVGKKVLIKSHGGVGTKDYKMEIGEYRGILLDFDGVFLKVKYELAKFVSGATRISEETLLMNVAYVITIEEYREA